MILLYLWCRICAPNYGIPGISLARLDLLGLLVDSPGLLKGPVSWCKDVPVGFVCPSSRGTPPRTKEVTEKRLQSSSLLLPGSIERAFHGLATSSPRSHGLIACLVHRVGPTACSDEESRACSNARLAASAPARHSPSST